MNKKSQITENIIHPQNEYTDINSDIDDDFNSDGPDEFEWDNSDDSYFDFTDVIQSLAAGEKESDKDKNSKNRRDRGSELPDPKYDDYKIYTPDTEDEEDVN